MFSPKYVSFVGDIDIATYRDFNSDWPYQLLCEEMTGSLMINEIEPQTHTDDDGIFDLTKYFANLKKVVGDVEILNNPGVTEIKLPSLESVGEYRSYIFTPNKIKIQNNWDLEKLSMPALTAESSHDIDIEIWNNKPDAEFVLGSCEGWVDNDGQFDCDPCVQQLARGDENRGQCKDCSTSNGECVPATNSPTDAPSNTPTSAPTYEPSQAPTSTPTFSPTQAPTTEFHYGQPLFDYEEEVPGAFTSEFDCADVVRNDHTAANGAKFVEDQYGNTDCFALFGMAGWYGYFDDVVTEEISIFLGPPATSLENDFRNPMQHLVLSEEIIGWLEIDGNNFQGNLIINFNFKIIF